MRCIFGEQSRIDGRRERGSAGQLAQNRPAIGGGFTVSERAAPAFHRNNLPIAVFELKMYPPVPAIDFDVHLAFVAVVSLHATQLALGLLDGLAFVAVRLDDCFCQYRHSLARVVELFGTLVPFRAMARPVVVTPVGPIC